MRFCLIVTWGCAATLAALQAAPPEVQEVKLASVVRTDRRTGRLVRTIVAPHRPALPAKTGDGRQSRTHELAASLFPVNRLIDEAAIRYDLDPLLVHSVIQVESNYNPFAVSPRGAQGLMQLMPDTATRLAVKDTFNPWENIDGGVRYLKYLFALFGDSKLALAAYNAGEGAVLKYGGVPPYHETNQYISKVAKKWDEAARAAQAKGRLEPGLAADAHPLIEQYIDSKGTLHLQTRPAP